ncbi:transporter substrate-binding domain-containing protein [Actinomadura barringtoniae]|uniref:Transporter substrate-binding domain-containing protein n=2 Tax=Actinomadura barringtoniae TaxID=1427535 RepID=A0A939T6F3_9ACTN|nr:transporter substrate-binding domain-containing protein [Actinomadura barringtoniae]
MRRLVASGLVCVCVSTGCAGRESTSLLDKGTLVAGVRPDLPGIGSVAAGGGLEGLDADVTREIARRLRMKARIVPARAADREPMLNERRADLVLTFWIRPDWKQRLAFAGPYYPSYQDILVRAGERRVRNVRDLKGRKICAVTGAGAADQVTKERQVAAVQVPASSYDECTAMLRSGRIDAITTNDTILAGLKLRNGAAFRLVNARFGEQRTGIGMRRDDPDGCEAVNKAITQMYQDGTMARLMNRWFSGSGLDLSSLNVPEFEGCPTQ